MVLLPVIRYGIYYKCQYIGINSHVLARQTVTCTSARPEACETSRLGRAD
jgi:hypothetical protein